MNEFGFVPSIIDLNVHWFLGDASMTPPILMSQGHGWDDFLPVDQFQSTGDLETYNCTNYGTIHALATLGNFKFNRGGDNLILPTEQRKFQSFLSERYTGVMTGTTINGNDPHKVIEIIRTECGLVPDAYLPFGPGVQTLGEYYAPNPMTYALYAVGAHWLKKYEVSHQWVFLPTDSKATIQQKMKYALQFSPLGASVFAWSQHADGLYYSDQSFQNHWVTVYDYVEGQYWMVFDSYDKTHKKLDWNFTFGQAKQYDINLIQSPIGTDSETVDKPEQVYLPYGIYLMKWYANQIFK